MYSSDYGYASTDTDCRSNLNSSNCKNNNWMFNSGSQWTLSPTSGDVDLVFDVYSDGFVDIDLANYARGVRPALFLKSEAQIKSGTGTESDPFVID